MYLVKILINIIFFLLKDYLMISLLCIKLKTGRYLRKTYCFEIIKLKTYATSFFHVFFLIVIQFGYIALLLAY